MLLGDAHIDVLTAELRTGRARKTDAAHRARREKDEVRICLCLCLDEIHGCRLEWVGVWLFQCTRLNVERHTVVPCLAIFLGELVALALLRMDVDDDGLLTVLHR